MQSTDIVLVQRITRKQNKIDFSVIENTLLNKKNKLTIKSKYIVKWEMGDESYNKGCSKRS